MSNSVRRTVKNALAPFREPEPAVDSPWSDPNVEDFLRVSAQILRRIRSEQQGSKP